MLKINDIAFPGVGIAELQRGEQKLSLIHI